MELLAAIVLALSAVVVGGAFLAREKYRLLSEFWYHTSIILDQMAVLMSPARATVHEDPYKRFKTFCKEHQDLAADSLAKLEIVIDDRLIGIAHKVFELITFVDVTYPSISDNEVRREFSEKRHEVSNYRQALKDAIKREFRKPWYWMLK